MSGVFLDAAILEKKGAYQKWSLEVKQQRIRFDFPAGFTQLRLIEECRALNCLDLSDPDNFDFMYDITMQMLVGKSVIISFMDDSRKLHEVAKFVVTDRYMNLRGVDFIDAYPIVVNWLVEMVSAELAKKYPRSLQDIRNVMSAKSEERMRKSQETPEVKMFSHRS